jgi:hypothetical protein
MNKQTDIGKKVEKALESLDGLHRAEPRPFLFTRVKARLERDQKNSWETIGSFLTRPVVAIAGLCLILAMNVFILTQKENDTPVNKISANSQQALEPESVLTMYASNNYEYENLEP